MKYLKRFYLFLEADEVIGSDDIKSTSPDTQLDTQTKEVEKNALADVIKNLDEFKNKRQQMENIFKDPKIQSDSDLEKELMTKVHQSKRETRQRNRFLQNFENVLRMERRKNALQDKIGEDEDRIKKTNDEINRLTDVSRMDISPKRKEHVVSSIDRNRKKLVELKDNINKNKSILQRDTIVWQKKREDFKKDMKDEEAKIKNLSSKI